MIEVSSKWVKKDHCVRDELEVVEVTNISNVICIKDSAIGVGVVVYRQSNDWQVMEFNDFLDQYKPYEPVYEYQYFYEHKISKSANSRTPEYYKNDLEFCSSTSNIGEINYQRLDFTKRERTCTT